MLHRFVIPTVRRTASAATAAASASASVRRCRHTLAPTATTLQSRLARMFSGYAGDSITYSGGQASEGQGGFYGSGGSRSASVKPTEHKPGMAAMGADVEKIVLIMEEVSALEAALEDERDRNRGSGVAGVTGKSLEIGTKIKKIMTNPEVMEVLRRLEVNGEPAWGLSSKERILVHDARRKVNEC